VRSEFLQKGGDKMTMFRVRDKSVSQSSAEVNISTDDLYRIKVIFSTN